MKRVLTLMTLVALGILIGSPGLAIAAAPHSQEILGTAWSTEVKFEPGQSTLPKDRLTEVAGIISRAQEAGQIEEIKVITWSDGELPPKGGKAPNSEVKLAEARSESLKKYINKDLGLSPVYLKQ